MGQVGSQVVSQGAGVMRARTRPDQGDSRTLEDADLAAYPEHRRRVWDSPEQTWILGVIPANDALVQVPAPGQRLGAVKRIINVRWRHPQARNAGHHRRKTP
tara:strand:+ start:457 stop:762 length:306 start_codon:yes stop_codon:yes gene_type:complete